MNFNLDLDSELNMDRLDMMADVLAEIAADFAEDGEAEDVFTILGSGEPLDPEELPFL